MSLIYITGPTASGKTTVGEALRAKGYEVHDTDDEGMRHWKNKATGQTVKPPVKTAIEDPQWHNNHFFALSKTPIHALRNEAKDKTIFVVGITANDLDYKDLFDKIIVLTVDEETQGKRIKSRTNHNYGKRPDQFEAAQKWRLIQIEKYRAAGAVEIDSSNPIDEVVNRILASG
jgi:dephospho-CoA kinase